MTWIKLDDKCPRHPKVAGLADRAFRWWIVALCYASEFLTDGILPASFLKQVPGKVTTELVDAGLWVVDDDGTHVHDYLDHQTGRGDVERERERSRQRRSSGRPPDNQRSTTGRPRPESREQIQRTDPEPPSKSEGGTRAPAGSLIVPPRNWGINHGTHIAGFCDWQCLIAEDFGRFASRLPGGEAAALEWAKSVRASGVVPTGKPWTFWNAQFDAAHGVAAPSGGFSAADWAAHMPGGAIDKKLGIS